MFTSNWNKITKVFRFNPNEKGYLLLLYVSVISTSALLSLMIIVDVRLSTLGEPFNDHLMAISIAISKLVYGIQGFAGLEEVLEILKQIPNISTIDLSNAASLENYQSTINEIIHKAAILSSVNHNQVHAYLNDQTYLYFTIAAFKIFGVKIQSLSFLWIVFFLSSVFCFLITYRKKITSLLVLWVLLISISLIVIANPCVGVNLITLSNYRFLPVLGLVPLFHIVLKLNESKTSFMGYILLAFQILLLLFVMLSRGSAQWMLMALSFTAIYFFWLGRKNSFVMADKNKPIFFNRVIASRIILPLVVLILFFTAKSIFPYFQHKEYKNDIWTNAHVVWHSALIGVTTDPVLMSKYVCSDMVLEDRLTGFSQIYCDKPHRYPRLVYGIFLQPSDMHGYQAAVRYLRERGSEEQIGTDLDRPDYFNLRWKRYDEIVRHVYFDMLRNNPVDVLYMLAIVKPLKFLKEALMYAVYFGKSIVRAPNLISVLSLLAFMFLAHCYLVRGFRFLLTKGSSQIGSEATSCMRLLLITFVSSLAPSILFYSQSHTIADSVALLIALILWFSFIIKISIKFSRVRDIS